MAALGFCVFLASFQCRLLYRQTFALTTMLSKLDHAHWKHLINHPLRKCTPGGFPVASNQPENINLTEYRFHGKSNALSILWITVWVGLRRFFMIDYFNPIRKFNIVLSM